MASIEKYNLVMSFIQKHSKSESDRRFMCLLLAKTIPDMNSIENIEDMLTLIDDTLPKS